MMMRPTGVEGRKLIGQILVEGAFITPEQLQAAIEMAQKSGKRVGQVLIEQGLISSATLATVLSYQLNVPIIDLKQYKIQPEALRLIPENVARQFGLLPLAIEGDSLVVAMEEPQDLQAIDTLTSLTRMRIKPVIALHGGIQEAINNNYKLTSQIKQQVNQIVAPPQAMARAAAEPLLSPEMITQAPIVRAVDMIITQAVKDRASDIHIEPEDEALRIRYRIDGVLHEAVSLPLGVHQALVSRIKVMSNMNIAERRRPQDGQFMAKVADKDVDFRVATAETNRGEMVVLRVLDKEVSVRSLSDLGLLPGPLQTYEAMLQSPFGMILISGPTGSGKTTTLYGSVNQLDPMTRNIMTIEDPIEYRFKNINQIQVNRQADITFASGLRAILRLDPDVILVGEIRDGETAETAINAALTGHLVLSSIHANDAVSALLRLIDLGVEPFLVTSAVIATLSQRLVRRVCPYCHSLVQVSPAEAMAYQQEMGQVRTEFHYGRGCNFCARTGYLGRIGVFELLPMSEQIRQLVTRRATAAEIKAQALQEGMITMRRDGMTKARDGVTTPAEIIRNVFTIG
ncbi:MAG: GspE/PulE family protein [Chloroflexi bacterium]|nr:GspE/PulE family protein [Chloroflexota bacterium]